MLKDFVFHASLLVSSFFFIGHWFRKFPLYRSSPWKIKLATGFLYGLLGLVLMLFSIPINSIIIDLRHIPIIVAALGGGPLPALIAASIIATGRLTLFGGPTFPAVVASINLMMLGAVCGWLGGRRGITLLRFLLLDTFFMISNSISICISLYHLGQQADALCILIFMWTFSNVVGLLAVYVYQYILRSHAEGLKLAESEKRYRRLISQSPDAVFVQTADRILFVNDMGLRLLGAGSREELLGRSFIDFVRADGRDELLRRWKAMGAGAEAIDLVELHCTMLTGKEIIVELSISPIVYEDQSAYLATVREITDRKLTERKLQEALAALQKLSDLDGLTGIANRRKLDRFLGNAWHTAAAEGTPISVILFDVDYFKPYNDTCGHQGGDEILKNIALAAAGLLQNTPHLIARYGGEEFAAVLAGAKQAEALAIAERMRRSVETMNMPHAASPIADRVTVSLGCATVIPQPGMTDKQLIDWADKALYRAKAEGRNRTVCHLPQDAPDKQGGC